ncbi:hypothetical protein RCO48_20855 [Peribacillus frigoritolerans]|nr:hypothetical protein [Peribacillus frigoritolerans]
MFVWNVVIEKENERVTGTITGLFHLLMEDGRITKIVKDGEAVRDDLPVEDAKGLLALPSFIEKHVHLDKTLMGGCLESVHSFFKCH